MKEKPPQLAVAIILPIVINVQARCWIKYISTANNLLCY